MRLADPGGREVTAWLILAVEKSPPGDLHDRAVVNLTNAKAQLSETELDAVQARVQHWRTRFTEPNPDPAR